MFLSFSRNYNNELYWLQLKVPFDANKLYSTEILSILLQNTPENRKLLGELDGIDVLLQQLAVS